MAVLFFVYAVKTFTIKHLQMPSACHKIQSCFLQNQKFVG